jgi:hypothetical protein
VLADTEVEGGARPQGLASDHRRAGACGMTGNGTFKTKDLAALKLGKEVGRQSERTKLLQPESQICKPRFVQLFEYMSSLK